MIFLTPDWGTPEGDRRDKIAITAQLILVIVLLLIVLPLAAWLG